TNSLPYEVVSGNLRDIDSPSIGFVRTGAALLGPDLLVPRGSVGLLKATGIPTTGGVSDAGNTINGDCLNLNDGIVLGFIGVDGNPDPTFAVGLDYQMIDAQNTIVTANLSAGRAIGVIRAASVISTGILDTVAGQGNFALANPAPVWIANADHIGDDGVF